MKKRILFLIIILFLPVFCFGQEVGKKTNKKDSEIILEQENESFGDDDIIEALVLEIIEEREIKREDGSTNLQQNIKLQGLDGQWEGKEFVFYGISDFDVISSNEYSAGDKVLVNCHKDLEGTEVFYVIDYIRRGKLYLLALIFALVLISIGGFKGFRSLLGLVFSFIVIMKFIIPRILAGSSPLLITIFGALFILVFIIYLTEGITKRSHLAVISILISLVITGFISSFFTSFAKLSGMAGEEAMFLVGLSKTPINFQGLLLAGIIIGTLGVLDDVVISQISTAEQIRKANLNLSDSDVFKKTFKVGVSHISSMTNTLFLAYAGASLPLLLLFSIKQPPFMSFSQIVNNEMIATEIVRTLVGSIGLVLVVPIATYLGVKFNKSVDKR